MDRKETFSEIGKWINLLHILVYTSIILVWLFCVDLLSRALNWMINAGILLDWNIVPCALLSACGRCVFAPQTENPGRSCCSLQLNSRGLVAGSVPRAASWSINGTARIPICQCRLLKLSVTHDRLFLSEFSRRCPFRIPYLHIWQLQLAGDRVTRGSVQFYYKYKRHNTLAEPEWTQLAKWQRNLRKYFYSWRSQTMRSFSR